MEDEDERQVELGCVAAIFPEITIDETNPYCATIDLPVHPTAPVKVVFPLSAEGLLPTPPRSAISGQENGESLDGNTVAVESHNLNYLPSLRLRITLPEGYPQEKPPQFELSTNPAWLSRAHLDQLQGTGIRIWEDSDRTSSVYEYIDSLQQLAETAFGFSEEGKTLEIPQDFKISLLDFDITATQEAFGKETFDCGVCLNPKKGTVCHRMVDCGHVFCVECLQDFYNNAIKEGDLTSVRCLEPSCAKKRTEAQKPASRRKPRIQISPSELLQIPLAPEVVTRYVQLKHKLALESDKNTVYCPRQWCQGAARSKKHRKPAGFEEEEEEEESDEGPEGPTKPQKFKAEKDLLCVCEDCSFAFCSRCYQGWHGEFTYCIPRNKNGELTEEDKKSLAYLKMYSTPCPTCNAAAQKTHGCNHMICFKCNTHFCYLCSAWLQPDNPYRHYNEDKTGCFGRLWELEHGDGEEAGYANPPPPGYVVPPEPEEEEEEEQGVQMVPPVREEAPIIPEIEEPDDGEEGDEHHQEEPREELQREGPLVLRLNAIPRPPPAVPAVPDPPLPHQNPNQNPNRRNRPHQARNLPPNPRGQGQRRNNPNAQQGGGLRQREAPEGDANARAAEERAHQEWVRMFVQMALNDQEDQVEWESEDEEGEGGAWEIPAR